MSEAITNQAREILGDLTTTFTAPEPCWTPAHHLDLNVGWLGQTCGPTDVQERHLLTPDDNRRPKNELSLLQLGILLARPRVPGYHSACTASATSQGWRLQFRIEADETFVGCCPSGFACHNQNGQTCISNARTATISTYQCESGSQINLAPMTLPNPTRSQAYIYAPMIQLAWKPSDLPPSQRPIVTSAPDEPSGGGGGGLSTGAIVGVAVGAAAVVIAIVIGTFLLWRMKRRGVARAGPDSKMEDAPTGPSTPPPGYPTTVTEEQTKYYYSGQPNQQWHPGMKEPQVTPYELGQSHAPVELSGARWDIDGRVEAPGPESRPTELETPQGTPPAGKPAVLHRSE
ncbi:LOW QUALITY PROTEIN: hypothetical protein QC764_0025380 [Podospora pseudoanserina]|uniref:Uncharacterized protein n=1 Tax=Podospora pseudoanserina TaxID=2609844 RepID=A0ABR0IRM4_9PEZI|nr:LOW QUALITY PROTEIN: hypothetical protein QC764_0025380 [Podospora pseudoanserina]